MTETNQTRPGQGNPGTLRFDGRVAVVTGAGRGLGRAYAHLLAARGARVVVNDLGSATDGAGADDGPAHRVVTEITEAGGVAAADTNSVATTAGAEAIVARAVERFGRVDIVVNNAGIVRWAGMPSVDADNLQRHLDVHLSGSFNVSRAAWPHMVEQGHGRIIMTTSTGLFGLPANLSYAAAKSGLIGMSRSMRIAGARHDIKTNLIAPAAFTRMGGAPASDDSPTGAVAATAEQLDMTPELAAPMVAFLAHESCPVSGEIYAAGAGRFSRIFIASTKGYVHTDGLPTIEDVAAKWDVINDVSAFYVPADLMSWSKSFTEHLDNT
jgi:NAD(P)-dependent dehydrogenase (short-subunit alcohol dehydrogenase family)